MKRHLLCVCAFLLALSAAAPLPASPVSGTAAGEQKVLVIMAKFPDVSPSFSSEQMRQKYFVKLDRYLKSISYDKTWVTGRMTDWYTLPKPVGRYKLSPHNLSVEHERVTALIQDTLDLADADHDFSRYSMIFIHLGAKRSDYGMMGLCGYPGMLGWESALPITTRGRGQGIPGGVAIFCEQAHAGVVFHDMAHIMGGVQGGRRVLPCLYDHDLQGQPGPFRDYAQFYLINLGYYDPMSCHYHELQQPPPGVSAWTKLRLGWIDADRMTEVPRGARKKLLLGPLANAQARTQVVRLPLDADTYYLIENRRPMGADRSLPAHGVLISLADDRVAECRHGKSPVKLMNADPSVPELKGAAFTPGKKGVFRDEEHGVTIRVLAQKGESYEVEVVNGE